MRAPRHDQDRRAPGPASPVRRWEQGVGLLSEDRKQEGLALSLSVADNVTLSRLRAWDRQADFDPPTSAATRQWVERLDIRCRGPEQVVGHSPEATSRRWRWRACSTTTWTCYSWMNHPGHRRSGEGDALPDHR